MNDRNPPKKRNYLNLIIGLAFFGYGSYRIFTYYNGAEYSNFRLIIAIGFITLGAVDLYKFFKPGN
ncbi:hypothetical protein B4N84_22200 [Flavobacterium sp. IR1]|jgi:hypothetical protein|nr:hypothetical protein B4N84_22200 [Flavobacterium sp. IR1]